MATRHGVAVFGCGRAGHIHVGNILGALRHRLELLYLVDAEKDKLHTLKRDLYVPDSVRLLTKDETQSVYDDPNVHVVVVASTTHSHQDITIKSLKSGKAVFCEKPISDNIEGVKECYDEAKRAKLPLQCSFNRRFDQTFRLLKDRAQAGDVGVIHRLSSVSRDNPKPIYEYLKVSGNILHDCAVHDIDVHCWLLNEFPTEVFAMGHAYDPEIEKMGDWDTVVITMKFPSNVITTIDISRLACYGYHQTLEVFGDKGMIQSGHGNLRIAEKFSTEGVSVIVQEDPVGFSFPQRYAASYVNSILGFLDVVEGVGELAVTEQSVINNCIIANACTQSLRTKTPIQLTWN